MPTACAPGCVHHDCRTDRYYVFTGRRRKKRNGSRWTLTPDWSNPLQHNKALRVPALCYTHTLDDSTCDLQGRKFWRVLWVSITLHCLFRPCRLQSSAMNRPRTASVLWAAHCEMTKPRPPTPRYFKTVHPQYWPLVLEPYQTVYVPPELCGTGKESPHPN